MVDTYLKIAHVVDDACIEMTLQYIRFYCIFQCKANTVFSNAVAFNPDGRFTIEALSWMEEVGIINLKKLEAYTQPLWDKIGLEIGEESNDITFISVLKNWLQGQASLLPTWRHFFWIMREIKLDHLAEQTETYLSGRTVEPEDVSESMSDELEISEEEEGGECVGMAFSCMSWMTYIL